MPTQEPIHVYNTLKRAKQPLQLQVPGKVGMYCCGPTVYNYIHIGNARTFLSFDMIRKYLEYRGYDVDFVQNITDVDDKIINKAAEEGVSPDDVAARYTAAFEDDMAALGVDPPTHVPKATAFISQMVEMIQNLIDRGHAYFAEGDVFFAVDSLPQYGKLSRRSLDDMRAGERIEVDKRKKHPMDFVLWKASKPGEPSWESPWGPGRPGWHIECSVMSLHHLGDTFDIHGGAQDLIFPHHENEVAQSEGALGEGTFAQTWLHAGLLQIDKEKMSKSVGNIALLRDLLQEWSPQAIRMLMLKTHYRQSLDFSDEGLAEAREAYRRFEDLIFSIEQVLRRGEVMLSGAGAAVISDVSDQLEVDDEEFHAYLAKVEPGFQQAMDDDFNTAQALAVLFEAVKTINAYVSGRTLESATGRFLSNLRDARDMVVRLLGVLGVRAESLSELLPSEGLGVISELATELTVKSDGTPEETLEALLVKRTEAREGKDWSTADRIRDRLKDAGVVVEDTGYGPQWKPVRT